MPPAVSEPWKTASNVSCRTIPPLPFAFAESLNSINTERRELESEMQQLAEAALSNIDLDHHATFTIFNPSFNEGVVGLRQRA